MADNQFNVEVNVTDNGSAAVVKRSIQDLNSEVKNLGSSSSGATGGVNAAAESLSHLTLNTGGARREMIVLVHELATGNFIRFSQSLIVMAERMDALKLIFSATGAAIGIAAAAVAALAYEFVKANSELKHYSVALAETSNFAATTSGALRAMSYDVGVATQNFSGAREAITALAGSGRFTAEQIKTIGTAASAMASVTGQAVDKLVGDYVKLADSPVHAAQELDKQYHFLTATTYEQIAALERDGQTAEAAGVAVEAFARHQRQAAEEAKATLNILQQAGNAITNWWHQRLSELNEALTPANTTSVLGNLNRQISALDAEKASLEKNQASNGFTGAKLAQLNDQLKVLTDQRHELEKMDNAVNSRKRSEEDARAASTKGAEYLDSRLAEYTSKAKLRADELKLLIKSATDAGKSQKEIADIVAGFHANDPKAPKASHRELNDSISTSIEVIRGQMEAERINLKSSINGIQTEYNKGTISFEDYISKKEKLEVGELEGELTHTQEMQALAKKKVDVGGVENQRYVNLEKDLNVKITEVHTAAEDELAKHNKKLDDERKAAAKRSSDTIEGILKQADTFNRNNARSGERSLNQFFMTDSEKTAANARLAIMDHFTEQMQALKFEYDKGRVSLEDYNKGEADLLQKRQDGLSTLDATIAKEKEYQQSFSGGWNQAFRQYQEDAANSSSNAKQLFSDASRGMEDAIIKFATTGKLSFKDLATSIITDIIRMEAKAAAAGIFKLITGALFGSPNAAGGANTLGFGTGANFGNQDLGGFLADGGPADAGKTYMVGERGPELLRMGAQGGTVIPNHAIAANQGDFNVGGITVVINGGQTNEQTAAVMQQKMVETMKQIADGRIANSRRPGGLMYA